MTVHLEPVQLVADVLAVGIGVAPCLPRLDAEARAVTLVITSGVGMPALELSDGTFLVLSWAQVGPLREALRVWDELGVKAARP